MQLPEGLKKAIDKATVKIFKNNEQINDNAKEITKLDKKKEKTEEDEKKIRQLQENSRQLREQQQQIQACQQKMGLGEKILRCYFAYKMASLLCHTLVGLSGGYAYGHGISAAVGRGVVDGIDNMSNRMADKIVEENPDMTLEEVRATMIEQTRESFEEMSKEAEQLGLTKEGQPLLSEEQSQQLKDLAEISRDSFAPDQAELYAAKCQDLGLDYNEALTAFKEDSLNREPEVVERTQEQESTLELEM